MDTSALKRFAQSTRRDLIEVVSKKIDYYLDTDSVEIRAKKQSIDDLRAEIIKIGKDQVIEKVAYTWFNRFCALRFMDVNSYTPVGVLSPAEGYTQPEILQEAKEGHIREEFGGANDHLFISDLLNSKKRSQDPQGDSYRRLLVLVCNYYHRLMPFLFEEINHYTELLLPDDLLSEASIISKVRDTLTTQNCQNVEVLGWLYQFYISEKKEQVFASLKKNQKVTPENIPAATQLFTPHWIVCYLVENTLGLLWMQNNPTSKLKNKMEYYIQPKENKTDFLKINSPEDLKVNDPACGSGHMLVYAFDLLYEIYEEEGYEPSEIPSLILTKNLFGLEIDERAGALSAFALVMKARSKQRSFLKKNIQPNICILENVKIEDSEADDYLKFIDDDLFTSSFKDLLILFEESKNYGSLINPHVDDVDNLIYKLKEKDPSGQLFLTSTHERVLKILEQVKYLLPTYNIVIANPPYMGGKGMNNNLTAWIKEHYPDSKSDLFAVFVERILDLVVPKGHVGLMTPFTWMFLDSYTKLRSRILTKTTITSLVRPEYHAFFDSAFVPICGFTLSNDNDPSFKGTFIDLTEFYGAEAQPVKTLEAIKNSNCKWLYRASSEDFFTLPSFPIAYWVSENARSVFQKAKPLGELASPCQGLATGENDRFLRNWYEVDFSNIGLSNESIDDARKSPLRWFPYNKGGDYRKWYGNQTFIVNWENDGYEIRNFYGANGRIRSRPQNTQYFFKESLSWSKITSGGFSLRYFPSGFVFDVSGCSIFFDDESLRPKIIAVMNSPIMRDIINSLSPTLNFEVGHVANFPILEGLRVLGDKVDDTVSKLIEISKKDWDLFETSWEFQKHPILNYLAKEKTFKESLVDLTTCYEKMVADVKRYEEFNNELILNAYGVQDELDYKISSKEITLLCNPRYRYGGKQDDKSLFKKLQSDIVKEFISYSVGCMFGRYSLDKSGLIIADKSKSFDESFRDNPSKFKPDVDNVIPVLEDDWFSDDIVTQFKNFLKTTFGEVHFDSNLKYIESLIEKDIRKYFVKDFYTYHLKIYKKRPIYWMFSSKKGSFSALIYMHRYSEDLVSIVLNNYLREFKTKIIAKKDHLEKIGISDTVSSKEKTNSLKEVEILKKIVIELDEYEHDILYPLATQKVEINLDDGVKANYPKLKDALKKIPGLIKKEKK